MFAPTPPPPFLFFFNLSRVLPITLCVILRLSFPLVNLLLNPPPPPSPLLDNCVQSWRQLRKEGGPEAHIYLSIFIYVCKLQTQISAEKKNKQIRSTGGYLLN